MSEDTHIEEHSSFIKTPQQLIVVVLLSFVVPIAVILMIVGLVTGGLHVDSDSPVMSEEAIAARLKPVGEVNFDPAAAVAPTAPPAAGAPVAPVAASQSGEQVYQIACVACHGAGVLNAPKFGDAAAWKPRIAQGIPTLYEHSVKGIRSMPAKGGNTALSDAEVHAAVDYMVSKSK